MFRSLRNTQLEIADSLMRFAEDITQGSNASASKCTNTSNGTNPSNTPCGNTVDVKPVLDAIRDLQERQYSYFMALAASMDRLNSTMAAQMLALQPTINTSSTIPSLNHVVERPVDMLDSMNTVKPKIQQEVELQQVEIEEEVEEEVEVEEEQVEEEVEVEEEQVEEEVEVEVEEEVEQEQEEEVEVEEWTYKGMSLFKDNKNVVYSNDDGEVGEPIGTYDPAKKILKKIAN